MANINDSAENKHNAQDTRATHHLPAEQKKSRYEKEQDRLAFEMFALAERAREEEERAERAERDDMVREQEESKQQQDSM